MKISSDTHLLATDRHSLVSAGPGAGKTFWLLSHIKNVLTRSSKIHQNATIGVISYTNVAADQLREELGPFASRADISTIHSFLYRNVVRPYVHILRNTSGQYLVDPSRLDGHDEHHVNYAKFDQWLQEINYRMVLRDAQQSIALQEVLKRVRWEHADVPERWNLTPSKTGFWLALWHKTQARLTHENIRSYKAQYWSDSVIDHDDVIYLAFRLLHDYPTLRVGLSARYPFLFVDEFQDTVPAQAQILRWFADAGTTVVVIGDAEQSIFQFAGTSPVHFRDFYLPDMDKYEIANNRRSAKAIVDLLNHIRRDGLVQECTRNTGGAPIRLLVGTAVQAARSARTLLNGASLIILARNQKTVNALIADSDTTADDQWSKLLETDTKRSLFLKSVSMALVLARAGRLETSVAALLKGIRHEDGVLKDPFKSTEIYSKLDRQAIAVTILEILLAKGCGLDSMTVRASYLDLSERLSQQFSGLSMSRITRGKFAELADLITMKELIGTASNDDSDDVREARTVHKTKGKQADNVLVCLHSTHDDTRLRHLTNPTTPSDEEQRITYVAVSRARDTLLLAAPQLSHEEELAVRALGIVVTRLD